MTDISSDTYYSLVLVIALCLLVETAHLVLCGYHTGQVVRHEDSTSSGGTEVGQCHQQHRALQLWSSRKWRMLSASMVGGFEGQVRCGLTCLADAANVRLCTCPNSCRAANDMVTVLFWRVEKVGEGHRLSGSQVDRKACAVV